jgi:hypothetical protein
MYPSCKDAFDLLAIVDDLSSYSCGSIKITYIFPVICSKY